MTISLIAAIGKNRELGKDNQLLWSLPNDLQYFKSKTKNKICIQGRKCYESIIEQLKKPLPQRTNIILTRDVSYKVDYDNCFVYNSVESILYDYRNYTEKDDEIMVIGGGEVYDLFLPYADRLYLTIVDATFPDADTYISPISDEWKVVSKESHKADKDNKYDHDFLVYEKK